MPFSPEGSMVMPSPHYAGNDTDAGNEYAFTAHDSNRDPSLIFNQSSPNCRQTVAVRPMLAGGGMPTVNEMDPNAGGFDEFVNQDLNLLDPSELLDLEQVLGTEGIAGMEIGLVYSFSIFSFRSWCAGSYSQEGKGALPSTPDVSFCLSQLGQPLV